MWPVRDSNGHCRCDVGDCRRQIAMWLAVVGLAGVPLIGLIDKAGIVITRTVDGWQRHWSAASMVKMVGSSPARFSSELNWSLIIGVTTATLAMLMAIPIAWCARTSGLAARLITGGLVFALIVPGPVVGIAIVALMSSVDWPSVAFLVRSHDLRAGPCAARQSRAGCRARALARVPDDSQRNPASRRGRRRQFHCNATRELSCRRVEHHWQWRGWRDWSFHSAIWPPASSWCRPALQRSRSAYSDSSTTASTIRSAGVSLLLVLGFIAIGGLVLSLAKKLK